MSTATVLLCAAIVIASIAPKQELFDALKSIAVIVIVGALIAFLALAAFLEPQSSALHLFAIAVAAVAVRALFRPVWRTLGRLIDSEQRCMKREEKRRRMLGYS